MTSGRKVLRLGLMACLSATGLAVPSAGSTPAQASPDEQGVWELERAYWRYVQDDDLRAYRGLWHENFLGWPSVSDAPVQKEHITDWITSQTSKGLRFKTIEFKPAPIRITGGIGMACYWVTYAWLDKDGKGEARTIRVTHAWHKDGGPWQIIGGMSMPEVGTETVARWGHARASDSPPGPAAYNAPSLAVLSVARGG